MSFLLVAVLTSSTGSFLNGDTRGFQTSEMQTFSSLQHCKIAGQQLLETYSAGNAKGAKPDRGQIRCVNMDSGEVTIVTEVR